MCGRRAGKREETINTERESTVASGRRIIYNNIIYTRRQIDYKTLRKHTRLIDKNEGKKNLQENNCINTGEKITVYCVSYKQVSIYYIYYV